MVLMVFSDVSISLRYPSSERTKASHFVQRVLEASKSTVHLRVYETPVFIRA